MRIDVVTHAGRNPLLYLVIIYLASRVPFVYQGGFPDGDQQHIALGVLDAILSGKYFHGVRLYGVNFSFGYYAAHFALGPLYEADPMRIFTVMNWSGVAAGLLALVVSYRLVFILWGTLAAILVAGCWMLTPGWWELTTFGHPSTVAMSLFLSSLAMFASHVAGRRSTAKLLAAALLYYLTLSVRADFLLGAPLFLGIPLLVGAKRWQSTLSGVAIIALAVAAFAVSYHALFSQTGHAGSSSFIRRALVVRDSNLRVIKKELMIFVLGVGPLFGLLSVWGLGALVFDRKSRKAVCFLLFGLVPTLGWWLEVEGPFRHLLIPAFLMVVAGGVALAQLRPRTTSAWALAAVVLLASTNQLACAATYRAVETRYPWTYRAVPGNRRWSTRVPLGDWFSNHAAASQGVALESREATWIATSAPDSLLVLTPAPFRAEIELLRRFPRNYSYLQIDAPVPGMERVALRVPGRVVTFLGGDPQPLADFLQELPVGRSTTVFIPASGQPAQLTFPMSGGRAVRDTSQPLDE